MDVSVEYREEDVSSGESKEKENVDDVSLFVDFVPKSNRIEATLDCESVNPLIPETKSIIHGQDPGADDLLNFENNITDYDWVLSPRRNLGASLEMDEHTTPTDRIMISNGQSNSPQSKLEYPPADCTPTTNVAPKLPTAFSNGVKSSNATIRRPSPSRKAPSTARPSRSSTPTSRATVTAATKLMAPIKRSATPTARPSVLPAAKSASRSSTPTPQPSKIAAVKSASRSSTPTQRPSVVSASKSTSRSSTPTQRPSVVSASKSSSRSSTPIQRPSIVAAAKSASRSSTPTSRPSNPSGSLTMSVNGNRSSAMISRGSSPSVKSRPSKNPPDMPEKSAAELPVTETNLKAVPKRTSCSPSRRLVSNGGGNNIAKYGITRGHGHPNGNDDDDVNPVLMGTKMVERVVNMRKLAPPRQEDISNPNNTSGKLSVSQENSGFGRSLSKKSFDMAMRHLDIRRSMPGNMRAMITKIPASSVYSVRPESAKTGAINTLDSSLATSSSESKHSYHQ